MRTRRLAYFIRVHVMARLILYYQHKIRNHSSKLRNLQTSKAKPESSGLTNPTVSGRRVEVGTKGKDNNQQPMISRGVGFSVCRDGPKLYLKTIERLGLYVRTQLKNGSDVKICLMKEKVVKPEIPDLADEHTAHKKWIWDFCMTEIKKTGHILEGNLCNLFAVLMSLCDFNTKNQFEASLE